MYFNSKMVRLRVPIHNVMPSLHSIFQFQDGAIKGLPPRRDNQLRWSFQFQDGAIKGSLLLRA